MNVSTFSKGLVLVATLVPTLYMALFFAVIVTSMAGGKEPGLLPRFDVLFTVHLGVMLLMFALITFYIVFLFRTDRVKPELKALWAVVLFCGGPIAMPIFWYLHILPASPRPRPSAAVPGAQERDSG